MRNSDAEVWFRFGCIQPKKATKREKKRVASSFWNRFGWVRFGRVWWENRGIHIRCSYALVEVDVEKNRTFFATKWVLTRLGAGGWVLSCYSYIFFLYVGRVKIAYHEIMKVSSRHCSHWEPIRNCGHRKSAEPPGQKTKQRKNEDNNTRKRSATGNFRTT